MIRVSLFGGLGNQMFQYAAGKALAERHGVELGFDLGGFQIDRLRVFLLDRLQIPETMREPAGSLNPVGTTGYFFSALRRQRVDRMMSLIGLPRLCPSPSRYREPHFHFDPAFETLGPDTELFGYFQSERYFSSIADEIRTCLQPREPFGMEAQATADRIAESELPVSIHVRRGDYVASAETARVHGTLDLDYYRKALDLIERSAGGRITLFVFSDDAAAATDLLRSYSGEMIEVRGDPDRPWEDMALMTRCRHHVIANSSFSWWGAWLNPSPDKIVIAPRAWFAPAILRKRNVRDLCPPDWTLI
jgi:hypothetical protein